MHTLVDRCIATTITTGVGALTLGNAPSAAYINLAEAVVQGQAADGQTVGYVILEGALDDPTAWEIGGGAVGGAGGSVTRGSRLSFDGAVYSSAPLSLGPGTKYVVFTPDAASLAHAPWSFCGTAGGSANALTLSPAVPVPALDEGLSLIFVGASDNTGAATIAVSGLAATPVQAGGAALSGYEIQAGGIYRIVLVGGVFELTRLSEPPAPLSNFLINGCMRVAQRSSSYQPSPNAISYGAVDRWYFNQVGGVQGAYTVSQEFSLGRFFTRIETGDASPLAGRQRFGQVIESRDAELLAGEVVTLSLELSKSAGWVEDVEVVLSTGTGVDEGSAAVEAGTWTAGASPIAETVAAGDLSAAFQEFSWTARLNANVREIAVGLNWTDPAVAGAQLNVRSVRLQRGARAAPMAHRPLAEELELCQRYAVALERGPSASLTFGAGVAISSNTANVMAPLPTRLRKEATSILVSPAANFSVRTGTGGFGVNGIILGDGGDTALRLIVTVGGGMTTGDGALLRGVAVPAKIIVEGAEL